MRLRWLTAGESHGKSFVGILEGMPAGLCVESGSLKSELLRRKKGYGRGSRQNIETEDYEIISGIRHGKTIGSPISVVIKNKDFINWTDIMSIDPVEKQSEPIAIPRPGHADFAGAVKFNHKDIRNVIERASARETVVRVALGVFAKKLLSVFNIQIYSRVLQIGKISVIENDSLWWSSDCYSKIENSELRCEDIKTEELWKSEIDLAKAEGNSVGGIFEVFVTGLPIGLGNYSQWDLKLDGKLAQSIMSLNAIKGVEVGAGFKFVNKKGSEAHDELFIEDNQIKHKTNNSGGITAGVTNGEPLVIRAAMKPLSTLINPLQSVSLKSGRPEKAHVERTDICAVPSAAVISESLVALVLADELLTKFGGDSIDEIKTRVESWNTQSQLWSK